MSTTRPNFWMFALNVSPVQIAARIDRHGSHAIEIAGQAAARSDSPHGCKARENRHV